MVRAYALIDEPGVFNICSGRTASVRDLLGLIDGATPLTISHEIDPARVLSNAGAKPGDVLFLTKAIGTGIVGTAIKAGRAPEAAVQAAVRSIDGLPLLHKQVEHPRKHVRRDAHACVTHTDDDIVVGLLAEIGRLGRGRGVDVLDVRLRLRVEPGERVLAGGLSGSLHGLRQVGHELVRLAGGRGRRRGRKGSPAPLGGV